MRIQELGGAFVICRGSEGRESWFSFFVDHDGSSWTSMAWGEKRTYHTSREAQRDLDELRRRARVKKAAR